MIILNIAGLSDKRYAGPNINVPICVFYEEKIATAGLYNTGKKSLDNVKELEYFFDKEKMKKFNIKELSKPFNKPDIVVFNSMYIIDHVKIARKLNKYNIPYIIIPRGALTKKAQQKKWYKKKIANALIFNRYIKNAKAIHFLTENELRESSSFKYSNCFVCGNGTNNKKEKKTYKRENKQFIITFIGRIEKFHKGLDVLVEAVNIGQDKFREDNIIFNLYGPDDNDSIAYLEDYIKRKKINDLIKINEPIFDDKKEKILLESDLFIHTSRLEGHPTSVIEAISYGVPVLVTPGTNISEDVEKNRLGFVTPLDANKICEKIIEAYEKRKEFIEITQNEIEYSNSNFEWSAIVKKMIKEYEKYIIK